LFVPAAAAFQLQTPKFVIVVALHLINPQSVAPSDWRAYHVFHRQEMTPKQSADAFRFLLTLWALGGLVFDWIYRARGGVKPTSAEKKWFRVVYSLWVVVMILAGIRAGGAVVANMLFLFIQYPLSIWEILRWRVRRKNPVYKVRADSIPKSAHQCPKCGLLIPGSSERCDCGYCFLTQHTG
jgi:ribosomal protein S27AE